MSIARNTTYNILGAGVPLLTTLLTVPPYLHQIGEARYGVLAIVWLLLGYFSVFDLGMSRATSNQIAKLRDGSAKDRQQVFWTALVTNASFGMLGALLLWFAGGLLIEHVVRMSTQIRDEVLSALPWIAASVPVVTVAGVFTGALEGSEKFLTVNIINVVGNVMFSVIPLTVAFILGPSLIWIIPAALLTRSIFLVPLFISAYRSISPSGFAGPNRYWMGKLLRYGAWVMITNLVSPILETADRFLISAVLGVRAVATYSIPFNLANRLRILPASLSRTLFPYISANHESAFSKTNDATRLLAKILTPIIIVGISMLQPFLDLWINPAFAGKSAPVGEIILLGIWINGLAFFPLALLQAQGRPDLVAKFHLLELLPFLIILWAGMKWFGLEGAAWAWTIRVAVDALLLFWASGMLASAISTLWPATIFLGITSLLSRLPMGLWEWPAMAITLFVSCLWTWHTEPVIRQTFVDQTRRLSRSLRNKLGHGYAAPPRKQRLSRISIAMATYNGEQFIRQQLDSLANQSLLPVELVVTDDCSTDTTLQILEEFSKTSPFPVRVHRNLSRLGYRENFLKAASLCTGELIAFCDQDDVWLLEKLATMEPIFDNEDVLLAVHDGYLVDAALANKTAFRHPDFRVPFAVLFGFALVFRKTLVSLSAAVPRPRDDHDLSGRELLAHDQWIVFLASSLGDCRQVRKSLVMYRQHGNNTYGHGGKKGVLGFLKDLSKRDDQHYLRYSSYAMEHAQTIRNLIDLPDFPRHWRKNAERSAAKWKRLAQMYRTRSELNDVRASLFKRIICLARLISQRGYSPHCLGRKALLRDILIAVAGPSSFHRAFSFAKLRKLID